MNKVSWECYSQYEHPLCGDETCNCFCHKEQRFAPLEYEQALIESLADNEKWDSIIFQKDDFWQKEG